MSNVPVGILQSKNTTAAMPIAADVVGISTPTAMNAELTNAALMAIAEINQNGGVLGQQLEPVIAEGISATCLARKAQKLICEQQVATVFGGETSAIRKAVKPVFEQLNALLWYPGLYEGIESSQNIFYTGSCPNQRVEPALSWLQENGKQSFFLIGSDCVLSQAANKIIKAQLKQQNLIAVAEEYIPLEITDFQSAIAAIEQQKPDVVINTLAGNHYQAFYRQCFASTIDFQTTPIIAINLGETELKSLGKYAVGTYASLSYLSTLDTPANQKFVQKWQQQFGTLPTAAIESAYTQVYLWKQAVELAESFAPERVRAAAIGTHFHAPRGSIQIEPNNHVSSNYALGKVLPNNDIEILTQSQKPIKPLPWLGVEEAKFNASEIVIDLLAEVSLGIQKTRQLEEKSCELEATQAQLEKEIQERQRVGLALQESASELRSLFAAMSEIVMVRDTQGRCLKIAPTNPTLKDNSAPELTGDTLHKVFPPHQADLFLSYIRQAIEQQRTVNFEYNLTLKNREVWYACSISPLNTESVLWVTREVTAQKQIESALQQAKLELEQQVAERTAALRESNDQLVAEVVERHQAESALRGTKEQLQAVLDAVPGIVSWISSDLRYIEVNEQLASMFELPPAAFVGQEIGFLGTSSEFIDFMRSFFASTLQESYREVQANVRGERRNYLIVAQKYNHSRAAFTIGIDITQRKRAESALRGANERLETVLEAVPGIVSWISSDLRYIEVNKQLASMFDLPPAAFVGQEIGFLGTSSEFTDFVENFFQSSVHEAYREIEANVDGEKHTFLIVAQKYDRGKAAFLIGIDITERKQAETDLRMANERLHTVLEAVPGIVSWVSSDLRYIEVNRHLASIFKLSPQDFVGQEIGFLGTSSEFTDFVQSFFVSSPQDAFREISARVSGIERNYLIVAQKYNLGQAAFLIGIDITERQKALDGLQQAETKYRNIFENAVEGIFQSTPDGSFLDANPALARIYGYDSPQELIAKIKDISEQVYVKPLRRQEFIQLLADAGRVVGFESQIYRRDGSLRWISENARAIYDEHGNLLYYEGTVEDITERKEAEEALKKFNEQLESIVEQRTAALKDANHQLVREVGQRRRIETALRDSEAGLRALFASMTDVITVFDAQGHYVKVVSTNSEVLYSPTAELIGRSVEEVLPRQQADLFVEIIQEVLETGQTVNIEYSLPIREGAHCQGAGGHGCIIAEDEQEEFSSAKTKEVWFAASVSPMPENKVIWVARDTTERRRVLDALQKAEEKYRSIFENTAEGIFQTTPAGHCISANPALVRMYGYNSAAEVTQNLTDVGNQLYVNPQRRQEFVEAIAKSDKVTNFESQVYRQDGSIIWTSENARAVRDGSGEVIYYEGTVADITKRKHSEEALRAEQEKSEQLLLNVLPRPIADQLKQKQSSIAERFESATILFADIVDFTGLSARVSPTELVDFLNEIFSCFDKLADRHGLEKIKTIGDAYMVAAGIPMPHPNHARAIAEMALDMQREMANFKRSDSKPFNLRIGIHTGPVVAGVIGIKKFAYDLWGDTVNVASRMESQGTASRIQCTEATYRLLEHEYLFIKRGMIYVKGKGEMVTYWLSGKKDI
ncbi:MAG: transporter substrate-binding protein [Oscillatoria sp. PMC 1068.18]|nr:transporter substrate-binding protein [Oscillatoria sp. PMC 1076.18]MEC4987994.1 transporter substrate-binding protein [Oscillatoria sp. PMC 1068.18]